MDALQAAAPFDTSPVRLHARSLGMLHRLHTVRVLAHMQYPCQDHLHLIANIRSRGPDADLALSRAAADSRARFSAWRQAEQHGDRAPDNAAREASTAQDVHGSYTRQLVTAAL